MRGTEEGGANVPSAVGSLVELANGGMGVNVEVSLPVNVLVGSFDGVLVSAANPVGKAEPKMGTEIRKVRALAETTSNGPNGISGRMGK